MVFRAIERASHVEAPEGQSTYEMANLRPKTTGLPFVVFISQRDGAQHAARVKWAPMPKVITSQMGSYSVFPFEHVAGQRLSGREERQLQQWVELNRDVIQGHWDGYIAYVEDVLEQIKRI